MGLIDVDKIDQMKWWQIVAVMGIAGVISFCIVYSTSSILKGDISSNQIRNHVCILAGDDSFVFPTAVDNRTFRFLMDGSYLDWSADKKTPIREPGDNSSCPRKISVAEQTATVEATMVHEFSPFVTDHFKRMFVAHVARAQFTSSAFQASCIPFHRRLTCVFRMWLNNARSGPRDGNIYQDSFFYTMQLDQNLTFIPGSGKLVGIPTPVQTKEGSGPEHPRLFVIDKSLFLNYINLHNLPGVGSIRSQFLWSMKDNMVSEIKVNGVSEFAGQERNWAPWAQNNTLYFICQLLPKMQLITCPMQGSDVNCKFADNEDPTTHKNAVDTSSTILRGGSPVVHYFSDYYLAISNAIKTQSLSYSAHITMINAKTSRVVFLSSPIILDLSKISSVDNQKATSLIYARSVFIEDENSLVFTAGVNDEQSYIIRLRGFGSLLRYAIEADQMLTSDPRCQDDISKGLGGFGDWLNKKLGIRSEVSTTSNPLQQPVFPIKIA